MKVAQILNQKHLNQKDYENIHLLSKQYIDINEVDEFGNTALYNALLSGNQKTLECLFQYQQYQEQFLNGFLSNENLLSNKKVSYIHFIFATSSEISLIYFLLSQFEINLNQQDAFGDTPLHLLASKLETSSFYNLQHFEEKVIFDKLYDLTLHFLEKGANLDILNNPAFTFLDLIDDSTCIKAIKQAKEMFSISQEREKLSTLTNLKSVKIKIKDKKSKL